MSSSEIIRPSQILDADQQSQRCDWYRTKLGQYASIINAASRETGIPPRLLATVVLNELTDVGWDDVVQDQQLADTGGDFREAPKYPALNYKPIGKQSFGIAQINPETAIRYNAVPVAGQERLHRDYVEYRIAYQLLNRPMAIHAAARVIKGILKDIEKHQNGAWARQFMQPGVRFSADDPYASIAPSHVDRGKEVSLAYLVVSIYNTGSILTAPPDQTPQAHDLYNPMNFPNALNHASSARVIADDLFENKDCGMELLPFEQIKNPRDASPPVPPPPAGGILSGNLDIGYKANLLARHSDRDKKLIGISFDSTEATVRGDSRGSWELVSPIECVITFLWGEGYVKGLQSYKATYLLNFTPVRGLKVLLEVRRETESKGKDGKPPQKQNHVSKAKEVQGTLSQRDGEWILKIPNGVAGVIGDIPYRLR